MNGAMIPPSVTFTNGLTGNTRSASRRPPAEASLGIGRMILEMVEFGRLADLCRRLRASPARLDKLALLAEYLRALPADAVGTAVAFLAGRAFPASDARVLGVRGLPDAAATTGPPLSLADVAAAFAAVADAGGAGARRAREGLLRGLMARASTDERETLQRIVAGEMRTGVSDGLVLAALGRAFETPLETARRAALLLGDLSGVAALAARGGATALASATARPGVPLLPMLAQIADDFEEVLAAHGGTSALEYKYDGARIQLHHDGERIGIWTRRLSDVTASLPDVVETARGELAASPFILDGEVLALAAGHEGVMAKDLRSPYEPGGRGKRWFKLKSAETVDCVIVAVDRGSGRRSGWLSNYHLAVRDGDAFADVGKTFKGLTDQQFAEMTERLWALATSDDGYTVRVRPEVVVEVAYNEIQKSPTYASGAALRFARITRIRDDKAPAQATTLGELRARYERQFTTKGRAV